MRGITPYSARELTSPYQAWEGGEGCAINADCRLADWQVNEETLVVECFNSAPISLKFKSFKSVV